MSLLRGFGNLLVFSRSGSSANGEPGNVLWKD